MGTFTGKLFNFFKTSGSNLIRNVVSQHGTIQSLTLDSLRDRGGKFGQFESTVWSAMNVV